MRSTRFRGCGGALLGRMLTCAWPCLLTTLEARAQSAATRPSAEALVAQLGDASFTVRADATRQLCMLGGAARPAIEAAARSEDGEVALRAKAVLKLLDELYLLGCTIDLAAS